MTSEKLKESWLTSRTCAKLGEPHGSSRTFANRHGPRTLVILSDTTEANLGDLGEPWRALAKLGEPCRNSANLSELRRIKERTSKNLGQHQRTKEHTTEQRRTGENIREPKRTALSHTRPSVSNSSL